MSRSVRCSSAITDPATAADLLHWLGTFPLTAKLRITQSKGDRPWESGTTTLTATWIDYGSGEDDA